MKVRRRIRRSKQEDLFLILSPPKPKVAKKKNSLPKEAPEDYGAFVVWFLEKNKGRINKYAYRRCIPNRYSIDDVKSYITEMILRTLKRRAAVGRPIEDPKLYFSKLIDYYCVEFQRMHGYIYGLPKRPRAPEAEQEIGKHGFNYLEPTTDIGYIDESVGDSNDLYSTNYIEKGSEPDGLSNDWEKLTSFALPEDRALLVCLYDQNMSIPEASRHLGIAISTAYQRVSRGMRAISGAVAAHTDTQGASERIFRDISDIELNEDTLFYED
jgi:hypothetical protein